MIINKHLLHQILTWGDLLGNSFSSGSVKGSVSPFLNSSHFIVTLLLWVSLPVLFENLTSNSMIALEDVTSPIMGPTPSLTSSQQLTTHPWILGSRLIQKFCDYLAQSLMVHDYFWLAKIDLSGKLSYQASFQQHPWGPFM